MIQGLSLKHRRHAGPLSSLARPVMSPEKTKKVDAEARDRHVKETTRAGEMVKETLGEGRFSCFLLGL